jgi:hypothetical protein
VQVWEGSSKVISAMKGPQAFYVGYPTQIIALWSVTGARCGHSSTLWAEVKNMTDAALPSNAKVWFWVTGPSWSGTHWIGFASVSGLTANIAQWYSYPWTISGSAAAGNYTYWTQVWTTVAFSAWKGPQTFTVNCP